MSGRPTSQPTVRTSTSQPMHLYGQALDCGERCVQCAAIPTLLMGLRRRGSKRGEAGDACPGRPVGARDGAQDAVCKGRCAGAFGAVQGRRVQVLCPVDDEQCGWHQRAQGSAPGPPAHARRRHLGGWGMCEGVRWLVCLGVREGPLPGGPHAHQHRAAVGGR